jgi:hypothetical protein
MAEHDVSHLIVVGDADGRPEGVLSSLDVGMVDHVRFEERHLLGLLEDQLSDDELAELGEAVERAHR